MRPARMSPLRWPRPSADPSACGRGWRSGRRAEGRRGGRLLRRPTSARCALSASPRPSKSIVAALSLFAEKAYILGNAKDIKREVHHGWCNRHRARGSGRAGRAVHARTLERPHRRAAEQAPGLIETRHSRRYMEGLERMPVALALTEDTFFYENPDFNAMFGLQMIDEIEYDDELATGRQVEHGSIALRLRSHGTTFEFILAPDVCNKWMEALPPRRADEPRVKAAV